MVKAWKLSLCQEQDEVPSIITLIQYSLGILSFPGSACGKEQIKGIQINKEGVKLSIITGDMILYIANSEDSTKTLLEVIYEFSKATGWKINTQKSVVLLHIKN